ncbi:LysM peptidoglycan-binding domain-containing protein [Sedimentisphaera salicampi]|nr:LysM peptidoglycan-binding domain-containing protein [Sedimentisphaera salicampi]
MRTADPETEVSSSGLSVSSENQRHKEAVQAQTPDSFRARLEGSEDDQSGSFSAGTIEEAKPDKSRTDKGSETPAVYHIVKKGETLSSISKKYFGKSSKWNEILKANQDQINSAAELKPGMNLRIPEKSGK